METNTTHSPLPWHVGQGNGAGSVFAASGRMRLEDGHTMLAPICKVIDFDGERDANAEYIVRAVNCHDELLGNLLYVDDCCQISDPDLAALEDDDILTVRITAKAARDIRAALAKAQEVRP